MSKATWNGAKYGSKKKARKAEFEDRKRKAKAEAEAKMLEILFRKF